MADESAGGTTGIIVFTLWYLFIAINYAIAPHFARSGERYKCKCQRETCDPDQPAGLPPKEESPVPGEPPKEEPLVPVEPPPQQDPPVPVEPPPQQDPPVPVEPPPQQDPPVPDEPPPQEDPPVPDNPNGSIGSIPNEQDT